MVDSKKLILNYWLREWKGKTNVCVELIIFVFELKVLNYTK